MRALESARPLVGICSVPGDKSISHRAALLAAVPEGPSRIDGFASATDCDATLSAVAALGARVERLESERAVIVSGPVDRSPRDVGALDCGRSGTTMRLLAGMVAGLPLTAVLTADPQLARRPMARVAEPLRTMGAQVETAEGGGAPMRIRGGALSGITYTLPVASAQVKSAVLLAGLRATGTTTVIEPTPTRDHTERLLTAMGASITTAARRVSVERSTLRPLDMTVPGDISSAAFLLTAAAIVPGSDVTVEDVGLNPTRTALLDVLARMGAMVEVDEAGVTAGGEPFGLVHIRHGTLHATIVEPEEVPRLIDELPLVALLGTQAEGITEVRGAGELRVKESDRIDAVVSGLRSLGANIDAWPDGFVVHGPTRLSGGACDARGDHRLMATFTVAGLAADGPVRVLGPDLVADSFPAFSDTLATLMEGSAWRA